MSEVTKSAPTLSATNLARSGLISASPMKSTWGCRAATSPRNNPTRPAPMMARPMRLGFFFTDARSSDRAYFLGIGKRQGHRLIGLGREVCRDVNLHHHPRVLGCHQHGLVQCDCFQEMDRFGGHRG